MPKILFAELKKAKTVNEIADILARFAQRWDNFSRHLLMAVVIVGVTLSIMVGLGGWVTLKLFHDLRQSRVDVTEARCLSDNAQNQRVTDVVLRFTPAAKLQDTRDFLHQAFPITPNCKEYALQLINGTDAGPID
jgi:hypothetical protein